MNSPQITYLSYLKVQQVRADPLFLKLPPQLYSMVVFPAHFPLTCQVVHPDTAEYCIKYRLL